MAAIRDRTRQHVSKPGLRVAEKSVKRFLLCAHDSCALEETDFMPEQMNTSGMSSECDESRSEWTKQPLGETTASFASPAAKLGSRVTVHLLDVIADPPVRARNGHGRRPLLNACSAGRGSGPRGHGLADASSDSRQTKS